MTVTTSFSKLRATLGKAFLRRRDELDSGSNVVNVLLNMTRNVISGTWSAKVFQLEEHFHVQSSEDIEA